ncbi:hypothetical protein IC229_00720 [Spirosoma sp. BT702]|uniref:Uncharacterized protein n=1 Tax=Spirosoma profusum TaxID=2771354 RepID=A0A926XST6_9BACT|nr:hypothetical protein [Spirosoma profusum]MBD2699142.1 hypothetical protein [Spirosoma profusum]
MACKLPAACTDKRIGFFVVSLDAKCLSIALGIVGRPHSMTGISSVTITDIDPVRVQVISSFVRTVAPSQPSGFGTLGVNLARCADPSLVENNVHSSVQWGQWQSDQFLSGQ